MDFKDSSCFLAHLLVIDDDNRIRNLLYKYLSSENYLVSVADSADSAEKLLVSIRFDLIITDKMMPVKDGIQFVKDIRNLNNNTPVIMLTAMGDIDNRLQGLSSGVDDYIAKPFEPKELSLRIANILKRVKPLLENVVRFGEFSFNIQSGILRRGGEVIKLTDTQKSIMNHFMNNINRVIPREEFQTVLKSVDSRTIDVAITRLRKKIESNTKSNEFILTVRNAGYKFVV